MSIYVDHIAEAASKSCWTPKFGGSVMASRAKSERLANRPHAEEEAPRFPSLVKLFGCLGSPSAAAEMAISRERRI